MSSSLSNSMSETIKMTNMRLSSLKEEWKDNVQKSFYNDKVDNLNYFFSSATNRFTDINNQFSRLKLELENI